MATEKVGKRGVNVHPSEWEALRRLAFEERTTVSEQVRRAVAEYMKRDGQSGSAFSGIPSDLGRYLP